MRKKGYGQLDSTYSGLQGSVTTLNEDNFFTSWGEIADALGITRQAAHTTGTRIIRRLWRCRVNKTVGMNGSRGKYGRVPNPHGCRGKRRLSFETEKSL